MEGEQEEEDRRDPEPTTPTPTSSRERPKGRGARTTENPHATRRRPSRRASSLEPGIAAATSRLAAMITIPRIDGCANAYWVEDPIGPTDRPASNNLRTPSLPRSSLMLVSESTLPTSVATPSRGKSADHTYAQSLSDARGRSCRTDRAGERTECRSERERRLVVAVVDNPMRAAPRRHHRDERRRQRRAEEETTPQACERAGGQSPIECI